MCKIACSYAEVGIEYVILNFFAITKMCSIKDSLIHSKYKHIVVGALYQSRLTCNNHKKVWKWTR